MPSRPYSRASSARSPRAWSLDERPAVPVGGPVPVPQLLVGAAHGFHRTAGRIGVIRGPSRVECLPVAGERVPGTAGPRVEIGEVEQGGGLLAVQARAARRHRAPGGATRTARGPRPRCRGARRAPAPARRPVVGPGCRAHRRRPRAGRRPAGPAAAAAAIRPAVGTSGKRSARGREASACRGWRSFRFGRSPAGLEQSYRPLQHPGPGQLHLGGVVRGLRSGPAAAGASAAGTAVVRRPRRVQQPERDEIVQGGLGLGDRAAAQRGCGVGVRKTGGGEGEQPQGPGRGRWAGMCKRGGRRGSAASMGRGCTQPTRSSGRARSCRSASATEVLGRAASQPPDQHQRRGQSPALLGDGLGGLRVDGDPYRAGEGGEQFDRRLGVHAAEGAGAHPGNAGQRAAGDGDDQTVRVVRQQWVDLLGVDARRRGAAGVWRPVRASRTISLSSSSSAPGGAGHVRARRAGLGRSRRWVRAARRIR